MGLGNHLQGLDLGFRVTTMTYIWGYSHTYSLGNLYKLQL